MAAPRSNSSPGQTLPAYLPGFLYRFTVEVIAWAKTSLVEQRQLMLIELTRAMKNEQLLSIPIPLSSRATDQRHQPLRLWIQAVRTSSWSVSRHIRRRISE